MRNLKMIEDLTDSVNDALNLLKSLSKRQSRLEDKMICTHPVYKRQLLPSSGRIICGECKKTLERTAVEIEPEHKEQYRKFILNMVVDLQKELRLLEEDSE